MKRSSVSVRTATISSPVVISTEMTTSAPSFVFTEKGRYPPWGPLGRSWRRRLQGVADTVDGADALRADLPPQRLDVAVDRPRAGGVGPVPHLREQLLAGEDGARGVGQADQQVELGGRQVDVLRVDPDPALGVVDLQFAEAEDAAAGVAAASAARSTRRSRTCTRAASSRMENGLVM